jgi:hypothetical protein
MCVHIYIFAARCFATFDEKLLRRGRMPAHIKFFRLVYYVPLLYLHAAVTRKSQVDTFNYDQIKNATVVQYAPLFSVLGN